MPTLELRVKSDPTGDLKKFKTEVKDTSKAVSSLEKQLTSFKVAEFSRRIGTAATRLKSLSTAASGLRVTGASAAIGSLGAAASSAGSRVATLSSNTLLASSSLGVFTSNASGAASAAVNFRQGVSGSRTALAGIGTAARNSATEIKSLGSAWTTFASVVYSVRSIASSFNGIIEEGKKATVIFSDFDKEVRIAASYARAASDEFTLMSEAAKEVGANTSKTASQAAVGLSELASRAFTVREQLAALPGVTSLAEATQVSLGKATKISSGILRGFGFEVEELGRVSDVLVGISGASAANINFIGSAARYSVPAARSMGASYEAMAATLGVLADKQFQAAQSGTAYSGIMTSFAKQTPAASAALKKLNVQVNDSQGKFRGLIPIFRDLAGAEIDLEDATTIFGRNFGTAALAIATSIDEVAKDTKYLETSVDGLTASTSKFQQAGITGSLNRMGSAVESLYIAVGDNLSPAISAAAQYVADWASNTGKAAGTTSLLLEGVRGIANAFLGVKLAVNHVAVAISTTYAAILTPLAPYIELIGSGLKKLGVIDVNPFEGLLDSVWELNSAQVEGMKATEASISSVNSSIDKYQQKLKESTIATAALKKEQADMNGLIAEAGRAAGAKAIADGKTIEQALEVAAAEKKKAEALANYLEEHRKLSVQQAEAAGAREKEAEEIRAQAESFGATAEQAQLAADKVRLTVSGVKEIPTEPVEKLGKEFKKATIMIEGTRTALIDFANTDVGAPTVATSAAPAEGLGLLEKIAGFLGPSEAAASTLEANIAVNFDTSAAKGDIESLESDFKGLQKLVSDTEDITVPISFKVDTEDVSGKIQELKDKLEQKESLYTFNVGLNTSDYEAQAAELFGTIKEVGANIQLYGGDKVLGELDELEREFNRVESIVNYNKQLDSLNKKLSETRQEAAGGKLIIDIDPAATAAIQEQISVTRDLKLNTEGLIPGLERVNGAWQQIASTAVTSVEPTIASLGSMSNESGILETRWVLIGETMTEVLLDGTVLVDDMTDKITGATEAASSFGSTITAAAKSSDDLKGAIKLIDSTRKSIDKLSGSANNVKFGKLAESTTAIGVVREQIKGLRATIKELGTGTEAGSAALRELLKAEQVESSIQKQISALGKEIFETGKEAEKTGQKASKAASEIAKIPASTKAAADGVKSLASANDSLAASANSVAEATKSASSASNTFTLTGPDLSTISSTQAYVDSLREVKKAFDDLDERKIGYGIDTSGMQDAIISAETKKYELIMKKTMENAGLSFDAKLDMRKPESPGLQQRQQPAAAGYQGAVQNTTTNIYNYAVPVTDQTHNQLQRQAGQI